MKLIKSHLIFTSPIYRLVMFATAALSVLLAILSNFIPTVIVFLIKSFEVALCGAVVIYSDTSVFGGLHNKEGGKIGVVQSSYEGEKVLLLGVLADRYFVLLWIAVVEISTAFVNVGFDLERIDVPGAVSQWVGILAVYLLATISVNINRYFYQQYAIQLVAMLEIAIVAVATVALWMFFPCTNIIVMSLLTALAIAATLLTVLHARFHIRRAFND